MPVTGQSPGRHHAGKAGADHGRDRLEGDAHVAGGAEADGGADVDRVGVGGVGLEDADPPEILLDLRRLRRQQFLAVTQHVVLEVLAQVALGGGGLPLFYDVSP